MKTIFSLTLVLFALAVTSVAQAHGDWFDTKYGTETALERKFHRNVSTAKCWLVPARDRARFGVESQTRGGVRRWNHFQCGVYLRNDRICFLLAHITGSQWYQLIVTSWYYQGCSTRDLRG